jgi:GGDEF domain-containing protein
MQPHFMPDTGRVDSRSAFDLAGMGIGACIACPLISRRGELLGALCAIDPEPQPAFTAAQCRLATGMAKTLATLFAHSLRHEDARYRMPAGIDGPTGLPNLHAWQHILEEEEGALLEHGENALAAIVELEEAASSAGDAEVAMARHAALLKGYLRDRDIVARIGHGRFALLLRHLNEEQAQSAQEKIDEALRHCGVPAAIGCAMRLSSGSLPEAFRIADIRMYNAKLRRH